MRRFLSCLFFSLPVELGRLRVISFSSVFENQQCSCISARCTSFSLSIFNDTMYGDMLEHSIPVLI